MSYVDDGGGRRIFFGCLICCACIFGVVGVVLGIVALVDISNLRSDISTTTTATSTVSTAGAGTAPPLGFNDKARLAASLRAALARNTNANAANHIQQKRSAQEDVELAHNTLRTENNVQQLMAIPAAVGQKKVTTLKERMMKKVK